MEQWKQQIHLVSFKINFGIRNIDISFNNAYCTIKTAVSKAKIALNVDEAIIYGINQMDMLSRFENSLENANINVRRGSSSHRQFIDSMPSIESHIKSRNAEIVIKATTYLKSQYYLRYI